MKIIEKIIELKETNQPYAVATVVKTEGSVPGKVGFKILVELQGTTTGTVGGGNIEKEVISECLRRLKNGESGLEEYILQEENVVKDKINDAKIISMMCNGKVWIYYDVASSQIPIYIFGGGHVGQALSGLLNKLGYRIILIDNRKEFANKEKNPYAHELYSKEYTEYASEFSPNNKTFIIIMTQGHSYDYDILKIIYKRKLSLRYVGVIASKSKSAGLIKKLKQDFGDNIDLSNLYTPIGLKIGGGTEKEIALSIASEIQAIRYGKEVPHMRNFIK
jgi:xanthine dehydrogenase accessory factor